MFCKNVWKSAVSGVVIGRLHILGAQVITPRSLGGPGQGWTVPGVRQNCPG